VLSRFFSDPFERMPAAVEEDDDEVEEGFFWDFPANAEDFFVAAVVVVGIASLMVVGLELDVEAAEGLLVLLLLPPSCRPRCKLPK